MSATPHLVSATATACYLRVHDSTGHVETIMLPDKHGLDCDCKTCLGELEARWIAHYMTLMEQVSSAENKPN